MTIHKSEYMQEGRQQDSYELFEAAYSEFAKAWRLFEAACHSIAIDHGFWPSEGRNEGELIALMHSELSELLEAYRKPRPDEHCPEFQSKDIEAADLLIRLADFARGARIDIPQATLAKMFFNLRRPPKHGKAF